MSEAKMNDWICLNVGGVRFETKRQTLSYEVESMLATMVHVDSNFDKAGIMRDGAYCLDRDPEVFKVVLGYLRCGELVTKDLSEGMMRKLKIECDFFNDLVEIDVRGTRFTK